MNNIQTYIYIYIYTHTHIYIYTHTHTQTMIRRLTTILDQDFFQFNKIYQQNEGLPMGAPFSPLLAETYI
jgi:hypothetical protein